jgi:hypothetical protein
MKVTLKIKEKEKKNLLDLFPKSVYNNISVDNKFENNLHVITPKNFDDYLHMIFYQKNINDVKKDFSKYEHWCYDDELYYNKWKKDSLDIIYYVNYDFIKQGIFSDEDKLLLSLKITKDCDKNKIAFIDGIQRNSDEKLKGLGDLFYENLKNFLREKNFNYVTCIPHNNPKVISWWKNKGFNLFKDEDYPKIKIYDRFTIFENLYISEL